MFDPKRRKQHSRKWRASWTETQTAQVGTFVVKLAYSDRAVLSGKNPLTAQWSPHVPKPEEVGPAGVEQYKAARDSLMQRVANRLGASVIVVE